MIHSATDEHQGGATIEDLRALIREAEQALRAHGGEADEETPELRQRLRAALAEGKTTMNHLAQELRQRAGEADGLVRAIPYQAIGIATGVGVLMGFLLSFSRGRVR
jgi:ElaB/YqjD/DUF883 family membrane-anchored ribosome-binding protein